MQKVSIENTSATLEDIEKLLAVHLQLLLIATQNNDLKGFLKEKISVETLTNLVTVFNYPNYKDKYYLVPERIDSIPDLYWYLMEESAVYISAGS